MKHHNTTKKFGRDRDTREALMRSLALALIENRRITTTIARAKALRPYVEKMVTMAGKGTLASQRILIGRLGNQPDAVNVLVKDIAPTYTDRPGGYIRILKLAQPRSGDAAEMAIIEFV